MKTTIYAFNEVPSIPGGPQERKVTSISNLVAGDHVRVGYREWQPAHNDKLEGFKSSNDDTALHVSIAAMNIACGPTNPEDYRAVFTGKGDDGQPYTWEAYRYKGRWVVGSSADAAKLHNPILILSANPMRAA